MFELNNYLKNLPQDLKSDHTFKDWLHDEADIETKRGVVMSMKIMRESLKEHGWQGLRA